MSFQEWWFHNHLSYPPTPGDLFELPAGGSATAEIACTKDATSYWNIAPDGGRNTQDNDNVCPGSPPLTYHTTGIQDVKGCALAITYKANVSDVKPQDFTIFSVNQTCVWTRFTEFKVPRRMPACPEGGCICAFFWIHSADAGGEESESHTLGLNYRYLIYIDYMNGFRCNVTNVTSSTSLAKPEVPRRCGPDPENNRQFSAVQNCTYGAKQPLYWLNENSNVFEGEHAPPFYNDLYNFADGSQDDIFEDSYTSKPTPGIAAALPVFANVRIRGYVNVNEAVHDPSSARSYNNRGPVSDASIWDVDSRLFRRYVPRALAYESKELHKKPILTPTMTT